MLVKTYFESAVKCFARWMDTVATDRRMASDYHGRACELIAVYARVTGWDESEAKKAAMSRAVNLWAKQFA